jgi:hypothetical protein
MSTAFRSFSLLAGATAIILAAGTVAAQTAPAPTPAQAAQPGMPGMPGGHHGMRGERGAHGERMMQWVDTDRDGQISRAELDAANQAMLTRSAAAFESADANRDGKLSTDEMRAFRQAMRPSKAN